MLLARYRGQQCGIIGEVQATLETGSQRLQKAVDPVKFANLPRQGSAPKLFAETIQHRIDQLWLLLAEEAVGHGHVFLDQQ